MGKRHLQLRGMDPKCPDQCWESEQLLRIGRLESLEVVLNDTSISRRHAEVLATEAGWVARDLGSTNGTFVNNVRVGRADHKLRSGDLLQCGNIKMRVAIIDEAVARPEHGDGPQVEAAVQNTWSQAILRLNGDVDCGPALQGKQQMLALMRIGRDFPASTSPDSFFQSILDDALVALGGQRGALLLADPNSGQLFARVVSTPGHSWAGPTWIDQAVSRRAFEQGQSLLCQDAPGARWAVSPSQPGRPGGSIVCALLRSPRSRLGVLYLERAPHQPPFNREELHLADAMAASVSGTIEGVQQFADRENGLFVQTLTALAQAVELRDDYTGSHTQRVTDYALLLADELKLPPLERMHLQVGTPLHDIGKIGISDAILLKPGHLTEEEYTYMKSHTWKGAAILEIIPHLAPLIPIVRNHHEAWDGSGYPDRLAGTQIPALGRIVAVADAFDAMTTDRPYRPGMAPEQAFLEIRRKAGIQFDPECAEAFLRVRPRLEELLGQQKLLLKTTSRDDMQRAVASAVSLSPMLPSTHTRRTSAVPRITPAMVQKIAEAKQTSAGG